MKIIDATITSVSLVAMPRCHECAEPMAYLRGTTWVCANKPCAMHGRPVVTGVGAVVVAAKPEPVDDRPTDESDALDTLEYWVERAHKRCHDRRVEVDNPADIGRSEKDAHKSIHHARKLVQRMKRERVTEGVSLTDDQAEWALRILRRLELHARYSGSAQHCALAREACQLLASLPGGTIDKLCEPRDGDKPSDKGLR